MTELPPPLPLAEDDQTVELRRQAAIAQQRRLEESLRTAHRLQLEAIAAMEEARRLMNYPFSASVALEADDD